MYHTLELGLAGTNEWLAASKDMTLLNNTYSGLISYNGQDVVDIFNHEHLESEPEKASDMTTATVPAEKSK
jgi:hypothetical protein